jgi:E3 ubiquitin-protein ligase NEDD4
LDAYFTVRFYKMILLKMKIILSNLESMDVDLFCGMTCILEDDTTNLSFETFTTTEDCLSEMGTIEQKAGGADTPASEGHKGEYIKTIIKLLTPCHLLNVFDEHELELLNGGLADIDVDVWTKFTDYPGYKMNNKVIQQFCQVI